jgi:hypothetical protein
MKSFWSVVCDGVDFGLTITWNTFTGYVTLVCILLRVKTVCIKRYPFTFYAENESCPVRVIPLHVLDNIISIPPCSSRVECGHFRESLPCCLFIDSCCFTIAKQEINSRKVKPFACEIKLTPIHFETKHLSIYSENKRMPKAQTADLLQINLISQ